MAQWEFVEWLFLWLLNNSVFEFEWDKGNRTKSEQKHGVSVDEVESIFVLKKAMPLGIQVSPPCNESRFGVIGTSLEGRVLHVAFTLRTGKVRVISARPAHKKERLLYEKILRQI